MEIPGNESEESKSATAQAVAHSVWHGPLKKHLRDTIPELAHQNIDEMLSIQWGKHSSLLESASGDGNATIYVRCRFKSSMEIKIARSAVSACTDYVRAQINSRQAPVAALSPGKTETTAINRTHTANLADDTARPGAQGLSVAQTLEIWQLLNDRSFEELNQLLRRYRDAYLDHPDTELLLADAYRALRTQGTHTAALFDEWIEFSPLRYQPYLAAAQYHYGHGWAIRGGDTIDTVSAADIQAFKQALHKSAELAREALAINPDLMPAYLTLIDIEKSIGTHEQTTQAASAGYERFPHSVELWAAQLKKYEPRWGGSFSGMQRIVDNARAYQLPADKLGILQGMVSIERSQKNYTATDYSGALDFATQAVSAGTFHNFFYHRAKAYGRLRRSDASLADINQAIALKPASHHALLHRANLLVSMDRAEQAMADYLYAIQLWPADRQSALDQSISWAVDTLLNKASKVFQSDTTEALAIYDRALQLDPSQHYTVFWRAVALINLGRDQEAIAGLQHSIELDPGHFESYRELDYLMMKEQRWTEIIRNWDSFLARVPQHAEALLERGGAHYHNGNNVQYQADVARACDLKSVKACELAASF